MIYHISWYIIQKLWLVDDNKGFYFTFVPGTITIHEGNQNTAQVTYNKDSKDITVEDSASSADPVCGEYECSQYVDNGNGNDWHYVTVTQEEKGYKWSNRAGVSWMLDAETLDIGDWAAVFKLNPLLISLNQNCLSYGWVAQLRTMNKTQLVCLIFIPMFSCYIPKLVQKICQNLPKSI